MLTFYDVSSLLINLVHLRHILHNISTILTLSCLATFAYNFKQKFIQFQKVFLLFKSFGVGNPHRPTGKARNIFIV